MENIIAEEANKNHQLVLRITTEIKKNLWDLAIVLKKCRDNKLYKYYNNTFEEYLGNPEIGLSRFFVYKIIRNYEVWIEDYNVELAKLEDIDSEKLYIAGIMATPQDYEEILEKARSLSRSDLRQLKSGNYEFDPAKFETLKCPNCGHTWRRSK